MDEIIDLIYSSESTDEIIIEKIDAHPNKKALVRCEGHDGNTLLMHALSRFSWRGPALIRYLLQSGSDVNIVNKWLGTPLIRACLISMPRGQIEILDLVLSYGADPNAYGTTSRSILFERIYCRDRDSMSVILLYGGRLHKGEYEILSSDRRKMLTNFYRIIKLSSLAYTQLKKVQSF
jgi:hypothetical protein